MLGEDTDRVGFEPTIPLPVLPVFGANSAKAETFVGKAIAAKTTQVSRSAKRNWGAPFSRNSNPTLTWQGSWR